MAALLYILQNLYEKLYEKTIDLELTLNSIINMTYIFRPFGDGSMEYRHPALQ